MSLLRQQIDSAIIVHRALRDKLQDNCVPAYVGKRGNQADLARLLRPLGIAVVDVPADGNCGYTVLASMFWDDASRHKEMRAFLASLFDVYQNKTKKEKKV